MAGIFMASCRALQVITTALWRPLRAAVVVWPVAACLSVCRVHPYRAEIIRRSKVLVDAAPQRTFTAEETVGHLQPGAAATADAATGAAGAAAQPPAATTLAAADAAGRV